MNNKPDGCPDSAQVFESPEPCHCEFCKESKRMRRIVSQLPEDDAKWLTEFYNKHLNICMDANYNACVLDGSWPSSVSQLTKALKRAKEKQK